MMNRVINLTGRRYAALLCTLFPYARKVRVVAAEHDHTLKLIDTDTWSVPGSLYHVNPLGKVAAHRRWRDVVRLPSDL
jgi:hypothetical protein